MASKQIQKIEEVFPIIGDIGRSQIALLVVLWISTIPPTIQEFINIFLTLDPEWEYRVFNSTSNTSTWMKGSDKIDRCKFSRADWRFLGVSDKHSIVTEFDAPCGKMELVHTSSSLYFAAYAIGAIIIGNLSDRYGRRMTIFGCSTIVMCLVFISAWLPGFEVYIVFRVLIGFFVPGTYVTMNVYASELVGEKYRPFASTSIWFFFSVAQILLGLIAMSVDSWRHLLMYCSAPFMIMIPVLWFLPESFTWLHSVAKCDEAKVIVEKIGKWNNRPVEKLEIIPNESDAADSHSSNPLDLFRPPAVGIRTAIIALTWTMISLTYYGVHVAAANLTGNVYRDFILMGVMEFPSALATIYVTTKFGRKLSVLPPLFVCGIFFIALAFIPEASEGSWMYVRLTLGVLSKFLTSLSFNSIYVWCNELYPTKLRQDAAGIFNSTAYVGNILAPWVVQYARNAHYTLPMLILGSVALIGSFVMCRFPETMGKQLPESFENLLRRPTSRVSSQAGSDEKLELQEPVA